MSAANRRFAELWRHELRWALTIRTIDPLGYLGWTVTHAFPLALIAWAMGGGWPAIGLGLAALGLPRRPDFRHRARIWLAARTLIGSFRCVIYCPSPYLFRALSPAM